MRIIQHIYKTKNLVTNGASLLVFVIILMLAGRLFIPTFKLEEPTEQLLNFNGLAFKYDDSSDVSTFIQSVKKNNGYICLGTSESGSLPNGNYWNFLNNDEDIKNRFSILSGAGRTCGLYIPLFLRHRQEVDSLKIIYLINPVYWRKDLSKVDLEYWGRYSNVKMSSDIELSPIESEKYFTPVQAYIDKLNLFQKFIYSTEYELRKLRRSFFHDLKYTLNPLEYKKTLTFISEEKKPLNSFKNFGKIDFVNTDTTWNILNTFHNKEWFKPIDENTTYRYIELKSFITTCRDLGIKATFILGPYNGKFISNYDPSSLAGYHQTTEKIRQLLINEQTNFIDASDISFTAGAFNDHQHHSSYGAYLIYGKIKKQLYEKNNF